jgi:hypothetical protein
VSNREAGPYYGGFSADPFPPPVRGSRVLINGSISGTSISGPSSTSIPPKCISGTDSSTSIPPKRVPPARSFTNSSEEFRARIPCSPDWTAPPSVKGTRVKGRAIITPKSGILIAPHAWGLFRLCALDLGYQLKSAGRRCHYLHLIVTRVRFLSQKQHPYRMESLHIAVQLFGRAQAPPPIL